MKGDLLNTDTIIAPITGLTGGSVHMIRISGKDAIPLLNRFFSKKIDARKQNVFFYGRLVNEENKPIDEVVAFVYKAPHSYTGEDVVEISCHANILITEEIIELFIRNGCRFAEPGEFTKRAFLNGKIDLLQAESVAELISARSKKAVENALSQLEGRFSKEIRQIRENIVKALSLLELNIDFSEEDIEVITDDEIYNILSQTEQAIARFLDSYQKGKLLQNGLKVLITGKPNVGKSSLMNALLEKDRVLVSDIPGTTRDIIHDEIYLDNILIKFMDTAGIRFSHDKLEQEGVKRAKELYTEADFILMLFDVSSEFTEEDRHLFELAQKYKEKVIFVGNKIDLRIHPGNKRTIDENFILISAKKKTNIEQIKETIKEKLKTVEIESTFINTERQYNKLKAVLDSIRKAKKTLKENIGHEFVAMEIREVIHDLGELTGEITNEDVLNNIFSNFCIGK
jgi:tRNA modification GTPase